MEEEFCVVSRRFMGELSVLHAKGNENKVLKGVESAYKEMEKHVPEHIKRRLAVPTLNHPISSSDQGTSSPATGSRTDTSSPNRLSLIHI